MEQAYAQALWKMIEGGMNPQKAVHALRAALVAHRRESLLPRIGRAFKRIAKRRASTGTVELTVARESDTRAAHQQIKETLSALGVEAHDLKTRVDDTIIGGWRLEGRETLIDASYKRQLLDIYSRVTRA